ncbi:MAG: hypothetical protein ACPLSA_04195 [Caldanaerobacter sp.]
MLEEEINRKNLELTTKNKIIFELEESIQSLREEKTRLSVKINDYNTLLNNLIKENENLKKENDDLKNRIVILASRLDNIKNAPPLQKIKNLFRKEED